MSETKQVFERVIDLNLGHDQVKISAERGYGELVEIELSGRDPTTVTIRLHDIRDVHAIGKALLDAADVLGALE